MSVKRLKANMLFWERRRKKQLNWINDDIKQKAAWMAIADQKFLIQVAE